MYLLEVSIVTTWLGIRRTFFAMGAGGTVESSVEFEIEGERSRLVKTWSEEKSPDTLFTTGLLV